MDARLLHVGAGRLGGGRVGDDSRATAVPSQVGAGCIGDDDRTGAS